MKLIAKLALFFAILILPLYAYKVYLKADYTDFEVYYRAAQRVKTHAWNEIYNLNDGPSPFRYAPVWLPIFRPFAELSSIAARMTWYFLQYLWLCFGFHFLNQSIRLVLRPKKRIEAVGITGAAFFFVLRFCLDTFTIGQVSSLLLLGLTGGLYAWMIGRPLAAGTGLFFPALFKIGPGFLYGLFLSARKGDRIRAWITPVAWLLVLASVVQLWGFWHGFQASDLWTNWIKIVTHDSVYYDASHYGNQSIKGALLRFSKLGWLSTFQVSFIYIALTILGCSTVILFWLARRPQTPRARGLFFSLGLFPYLWFMPETFKYSMTVLAIPVAFLLADPQLRKNQLSLFSLILGYLTLSLPGKDIVGDLLFFGLQRQSIPLFTTLILALAVLREALRESIPSHLASTIQALISPPALGPWDSSWKPSSSEPQISVLIPLALDNQQQTSPELLNQTLTQSLHFFRSQQSSLWHQNFEIIVVPYGNRISRFHPHFKIVESLATTDFPEIRIIENDNQSSNEEWRGAVLRKAFLNSRGNILFFLNPELPCDPSFYAEAYSLISQGYDLIRANRRLDKTRFKVPVRYLSLVYARHRMGLFFNKIIQNSFWKFPSLTTDTHSGILVTTRKLAHQIFSLQSRADFLFDLELCLISRAHGAKEKDLPIRLFLSHEKTLTTIAYETLSILLGIPRLAWRYRKGCYHPIPPHSSKKWLITADDWGMSPGVNQGIIELSEAGIIKRTSAMAESAYLTERLPDLLKLVQKQKLEIGIHFNLTHEKKSPLCVLFRALRLEKHEFYEEVRKEFKKQIDLLRNAGIQPSYLDGHHHIHLVPGVIEAISDLLHESGIRQIRLLQDQTLWMSRRFPLLILSKLAESKIKKFGFESLPCFYPSLSHFRDPGLLRSALLQNATQQPTEVIVHPSAHDDLELLGIPDSYTAERVQELKALRMLRSFEN